MIINLKNNSRDTKHFVLVDASIDAIRYTSLGPGETLSYRDTWTRHEYATEDAAIAAHNLIVAPPDPGYPTRQSSELYVKEDGTPWLRTSADQIPPTRARKVDIDAGERWKDFR